MTMLDLDDIGENVESETRAYYKTLLIKGGIFCASLAVVFGILVVSAFFANRSWKKGLMAEVQAVLEKNESDFIPYEYVRVKSNLTVGIAVFRCKNSKGTQRYGVISRVSTLYGPMAAVYLYSDNSPSADFVDFVLLEGSVHDRVSDASIHSQIDYWGKKIPHVVKNQIIPKKKNETKNRKGRK